MVFSNPYLRSEYQKNCLSRETAETFLKYNVQGCEIKPVAGDGKYILNLAKQNQV